MFKGNMFYQNTDQGHPIDNITFITFIAASQSDTDDGSEIDVIYHNLPAVTENLSISSQVMEASSNVKDQRVDEGTFGIFSEIISNNRVSTNTSPAISNQLVEVEK